MLLRQKIQQQMCQDSIFLSKKSNGVSLNPINFGIRPVTTPNKCVIGVLFLLSRFHLYFKKIKRVSFITWDTAYFGVEDKFQKLTKCI